MYFISAADLDRWFDWDGLIVHLREAFREDCQVPPRHHHPIPVPGQPEASLQLMPAWTPGGYLGVKVATVFPGNRARGRPATAGGYYLASANTGEPLALIDGSALTPWRTAAASALAARYLARTDCARLLVVGTGRLAGYLARAHCAGRPIRRIAVWGRDPDAARALAEALRLPGVAVRAARDLAEAAREADLISCATLSRVPLIRGEWLAPGTHLDLVGGFRPHMREADDEAVRRATLFVDTREGALAEAGDLVQPLRSGRIAPGDIAAELGDLARGTHPGRSDAAQITLFKSVGTALEDLAAARLAYECARRDAAGAEP